MLAEVKAALEANVPRPKLSLVTTSPNKSANMSESGFDKAAFVRSCLTEHPEMRNADIQRKATELGYTISLNSGTSWHVAEHKRNRFPILLPEQHDAFTKRHDAYILGNVAKKVSFGLWSGLRIPKKPQH